MPSTFKINDAGEDVRCPVEKCTREHRCIYPLAGGVLLGFVTGPGGLGLAPWCIDPGFGVMKGPAGQTQSAGHAWTARVSSGGA